MNRDDAKRIVWHAVQTTEPRWRHYAFSWKDIDVMFIQNGYEQQGFKCFRFVPYLRTEGVLSIDALGSILDDRLSTTSYDNEYAKGSDAPFYAALRKDSSGKNGRAFARAVDAFRTADARSGGRFFWMYLWYMLQACSYLRRHHGSSFATYIMKAYGETSETKFLNITDGDWQSFLKRVKPWTPLKGIGENVFDFLVGDIKEAPFARDSYKFDTANQHFLNVTGMTGISSLIAPLERGSVMDFLRSLELPYTLREVNKGIYTYCSLTEGENYGFCRNRRDCDRCAVSAICEKHF